MVQNYSKNTSHADTETENLLAASSKSASLAARSSKRGYVGATCLSVAIVCSVTLAGLPVIAARAAAFASVVAWFGSCEHTM